jgi:hypothetical protein
MVCYSNWQDPTRHWTYSQYELVAAPEPAPDKAFRRGASTVNTWLSTKPVDNSVRILSIRMLSSAQAEENVVVLNFKPEFSSFISWICDDVTGGVHRSFISFTCIARIGNFFNRREI